MKVGEFMNLTEQEKDLLKCAFEVASHNCSECLNRGWCNQGTFNIAGQELLVKLDIIPFVMTK